MRSHCDPRTAVGYPRKNAGISGGISHQAPWGLAGNRGGIGFHSLLGLHPCADERRHRPTERTEYFEHPSFLIFDGWFHGLSGLFPVSISVIPHSTQIRQEVPGLVIRRSNLGTGAGKQRSYETRKATTNRGVCKSLNPRNLAYGFRTTVFDPSF